MTSKHIVYRGLLYGLIGFFSITIYIRCTEPMGKGLESSLENGEIAYPHPLDPLDSTELVAVREIVENEIDFTEDHYFSFITLKEPPKAEVLSFTQGDSIKRKAIASIYNYPESILFEAVVDLNDKKITSMDTLPGLQPVGNFKRDSVVLSEVMRNSEEWVAALERRGISIDSVTFRGGAAADMGLAPKGHREQIVVAKYKDKKNRLNITGLAAFVDLTDKKILKIIEEETGFAEEVDVNYFEGDSARSIIPEAKPIKISQPEGLSFKVQGHEIIGDTWKLRYGISNREGLVLYQAMYNDQGTWRSVMYRGSMAEMVVNYGSPDLVNASYNFFDVGVYRLGQSKARPLAIGADAPENAVYLPAVFHNDTAKVIPVENAVAVYEEFGGPLWRHDKHARHATNLVVKYYTTIGNYDYGFKWTFKQDGTIEVATELTGIVHIRAVNRVNDLPGASDETYKGKYFGTLVEEHVEAGNHQHFFVYRLDMDVDGSTNTVGEMNAVAMPPGKGNPYGNSVISEMTYFDTEKDAQRLINASSSRHWMVMNDAVQNKWGHHASYTLMPGAGVRPLASPGSSLLNRAGFLHNHLWVTPYDEKEIYPAGDYPASNQIGAGLPAWTAANRQVSNTDVVLWYVSGITHIVRPEEWPVMAVHEMKFALRPWGFFSQSPVVTMPKKPADSSAVALDQNIPLCPDTTAQSLQPQLAKASE